MVRLTYASWDTNFQVLNICYAGKAIAVCLRELIEKTSVIQVLPTTEEGNWRNNKLPRDYERMMQKIMFRVGPTTIATKRLHRMCMKKREAKFSETARMSTPQGREMVYRRLLNEKPTLWPFAK
ncbi:unnamed protein product [Dibothriocephalus latus]|uniref:Uncharacterized protein n=1 Tax=Dibothriocephalus latus TaxID=60516 RepID=A0A3P7LRQ0_DIBLA|nr:unnamed protein product [Dibothriocephalus latus]